MDLFSGLSSARDVPVSPGEDADVDVTIRNVGLTCGFGPIVASRVLFHGIHVVAAISQHISHRLPVIL
jgi:hypothetical protein